MFTGSLRNHHRDHHPYKACNKLLRHLEVGFVEQQ